MLIILVFHYGCSVAITTLVFVIFSLGMSSRIIIENNDGPSSIAISPHISATAPYAGRLITSCPSAVPK